MILIKNLKKVKCLSYVTLCFFSFFVLISSVLFFRNLANWLHVNHKFPANVDFICTFGKDKLRENYSLHLISKYPAATWIVNTFDSSSFTTWAKSKGIDRSRIVAIDSCESTFSEIHFFRKTIDAIKTRRGTKIGFVSSPLHMKRIILISRMLFPKNMELYALPIPLEEYGFPADFSEKWWTKKYCSKIVISEFKKIIGDVISTVPILGSAFRKAVEPLNGKTTW